MTRALPANPSVAASGHVPQGANGGAGKGDPLKSGNRARSGHLKAEFPDLPGTGDPARRCRERQRCHGVPLAVAVLALAGGVFGVLTATVMWDGEDGVPSLDSRVLSDVVAVRATWVTDLARLVTALGTSPVLYGLLILLGLARWRRTGTWVMSAVAVAALALGQTVRLGINGAVARARPPEQVWLAHPVGYSYPSGHTTSAVIGYGLLAALAAGLMSRYRAALFAAAGIVAMAVGLSRVYLGVHWLTDVVGGWALGTAWLALVYLGFRHPRFGFRHPRFMTVVDDGRSSPLTPGTP